MRQRRGGNCGQQTVPKALLLSVFAGLVCVGAALGCGRGVGGSVQISNFVYLLVVGF